MIILRQKTYSDIKISSPNIKFRGSNIRFKQHDIPTEENSEEELIPVEDYIPTEEDDEYYEEESE